MKKLCWAYVEADSFHRVGLTAVNKPVNIVASRVRRLCVSQVLDVCQLCLSVVVC